MERGLIQAATYGRGTYEINLSPGKIEMDVEKMTKGLPMIRPGSFQGSRC